MTVHVGQPKTGSTSLQQTLDKSRSQLAEKGIYFPDIYPHAGNATILAYHLLKDPLYDGPVPWWLKKTTAEIRDLAVAEWSRILAEGRDQSLRHLLLSSEHYFADINDLSVKRLDTSTAHVAQTRTIVTYIRRPDQYYLSALQQALRNWQISELCCRNTLTKQLGPLLRNWTGQVKLLPFDKASLANGNIVDDFCKHILPELDPGTLFTGRQLSNVSYSAEMISVLYDLVRGRVHIPAPQRVIYAELRKAEKRISNPTRPTLYPHVSERLLEWFAPDIDWLRREQGVVFKSLPETITNVAASDVPAPEFQAIEELCPVNPDRKAALLNRVRRRATLPRPVRRWLTNW